MERAVLQGAFALSLSCGAALAQSPAMPVEFPAGAASVEPVVLLQRLSGKVFRVATAGGNVWRWQFQSNGNFFLNVGNFSDTGKWRAEGSAVCTEPQKNPASCNEMRLVGDTLYMKRDSGEIVKLEPN